jgi:hypothetical protein
MREFTFGCKMKFLVFFSFSLSTLKSFSSQLPEGRIRAPCALAHFDIRSHICSAETPLWLQIAIRAPVLVVPFHFKHLVLSLRPIFYKNSIYIYICDYRTGLGNSAFY